MKKVLILFFMLAIFSFPINLGLNLGTGYIKHFNEENTMYTDFGIDVQFDGLETRKISLYPNVGVNQKFDILFKSEDRKKLNAIGKTSVNAGAELKVYGLKHVEPFLGVNLKLGLAYHLNGDRFIVATYDANTNEKVKMEPYLLLPAIGGEFKTGVYYNNFKFTVKAGAEILTVNKDSSTKVLTIEPLAGMELGYYFNLR